MSDVLLPRMPFSIDSLCRPSPEPTPAPQPAPEPPPPAGVAIHGNLRAATEGSGKSGSTFTNEGSHWNDYGSKIIAKALAPLFNFVH